jgi:hypothetical protein
MLHLYFVKNVFLYESKDMQYTSVYARMLTFADKPIPTHQPYYIHKRSHTKKKILIYR